MKPKYFFIVIVVIVAMGLFAWVVMREEEPGEIDQTKVVVAFGDSLVAGVGAEEGKSFVSLVSNRLGIPIINAGKSGDTTESASLRLENDVISQNPDVVVVLLGGNDTLRRVPEEQTFGNLELIVDQLQAREITVVLLGVRGGLLTDTYRNNFDKLAKEKKLVYLPNVLEGIFGDSRLMADGIHPNAEGYAKIADRLEPVLRGVLSSPSF